LAEKLSDDKEISGLEQTVQFNEETAAPGAPAAPRMLGHYELVRMLGRGGMGEVWLGRDVKLDRLVAIKTMRREIAADESLIARFYREARAVAKLNHPNIVHINHIGEQDDLLYFAMEYVDGSSLAERLKLAGRMPFGEARRILQQTVEGLGYACDNGIIHRDIKPANIMLTKSGHVKIADFGLAKFLSGDSQMTATGSSMGSPSYMSPEQAKGEHADHRSDIYSLGITFYYMLTGELPHTASTPLAVLVKHLQEPLPEPEFFQALGGGAVLTFLKRVTAKSREERFQNYNEIQHALRSFDDNGYSANAVDAFGATVPLGASAISTVVASAGQGAAGGARAKAFGKWLVTLLTLTLALVGAAVILQQTLKRDGGGRKSRNVAGIAPLSTPTPPPTRAVTKPEKPSVPGDDNRPPIRMFPRAGGKELPRGSVRNKLRDSATGFLQVQEAYDNYDYARGLEIVTTALGSPAVPPPQRTILETTKKSMELLKSFREGLTAAATAKAGSYTMNGPRLGQVTLTKVTRDSFTFRDTAGTEHPMKWTEMPPLQVLTMGKDLLPAATYQAAFDEFEAMYGLGQAS
jgi:hypothetical protein